MQSKYVCYHAVNTWTNPTDRDEKDLSIRCINLTVRRLKYYKEHIM